MGNDTEKPADEGRRSSEELGLAQERAETANTWPIVKLTVAADGHIAGASFYTAGLPQGVHDLWCVPVAAAEEIKYLRTQLDLRRDWQPPPKMPTWPEKA